MKVYELSKQLTKNVGYDVKNGDLINCLKKNGFKVSSHNQSVTEEMIEVAEKHFVKIEKVSNEELNVESEEKIKKKSIESEVKPEKVFKADDVIPCRSVTPWKVVALGIDKNTTYHWGYYGDVDYISYRDLQALRRTTYITKPMIIIEDPDLCYQWRRELGDTYKLYIGVEYPEEFFDKPDDEFEKILKKAPEVLREVLKTTAINMIRNENYPTIHKLNLMDEILGTSLKEFV